MRVLDSDAHHTQTRRLEVCITHRRLLEMSITGTCRRCASHTDKALGGVHHTQTMRLEVCITHRRLLEMSITGTCRRCASHTGATRAGDACSQIDLLLLSEFQVGSQRNLGYEEEDQGREDRDGERLQREIYNRRKVVQLMSHMNSVGARNRK
jgi:hypothetical protein